MSGHGRVLADPLHLLPHDPGRWNLVAQRVVVVLGSAKLPPDVAYGRSRSARPWSP